MLLEIGFIGAGKVGKALGLYFRNRGLDISGYYSRTAASAQDAAELTRSKEFTTIKALAAASSVIFVTAPDQAFTEIDNEITAMLFEQQISKETIWIHASGAHPSGYLTGIKQAGCAVASMHPLQSFGEPASSADRLSKTWFTLEGTEKAVHVAKMILYQTGNPFSLISTNNKPLYHAGACVISNFLVTLLDSGIRFFEAAGMNREHTLQAIDPLIEATLSNIREKGTINALTGPIVRGDVNTVSVHLKALEAGLPDELGFYKALAHKTIHMLQHTRLTDEQTKNFEHILEDSTHVR